MNFTRPARCTLCNFSRAASAAPRVPRRQFHPSPFRLDDQRPKDPAVSVAADTPKTTKQAAVKRKLGTITRKMRAASVRPYTEEELAQLREVYSAQQVAAIEAGEAAIDPKDFARQFAVRTDPMRLKYLDDFSHVEPGVDKHVRAPETNSDPTQKLKSTEDLMQDFAQYIQEMPRDMNAAHFVRWAENNRLTKGKEEAERRPHTSLAPDFFQEGDKLRVPEEEGKEGQARDQSLHRPAISLEGVSPPLAQLIQSTGLSQEYIKSLSTKSLVFHSVTNQTRLGKVQRFYCLAIAGNRDGLLGLGEAKSFEAADAIEQAKYRAIRNMRPILRYEQRTIYGDVTAKVGAMDLKLMTRPPGFGIRCQSLIYEMCLAAGITDLAARVNRSRNKMNTVKAAYEALLSQRNPEDVARARGKKMVDVRKVYYSGRVF
ncbi:hypothetical protein BO86DRAFT_406194 [Aspergillus japonicus CBS 114.51]|uniref:Small ribosomal subunit protein uS5m n=2 Tax=Aspergillus TaxID=5052 RepID=A0A2V5GYQ0_ASPV1|nr:hypothetical protein BO86DRAFT_406194 [Aspergillus japonicus CBS 114.51]PYI14364.1 hypothetical protein BO99DRAFT_446930 [Aspergillus violaceofuscus CBS 115571]RAH86486.1 hypothetical protein BO86DRAFT_406194 [Aspergillus japonicus CBS 114.51]